MKSLLIGMDGAQIDTFKRGWTPFIESLIEKGDTLHLTEDLVSRGWNEIVTGQGAEMTGALYNRAVLNGTYEWNLKFGLSDIPDLGTDIKPLWQALNERGYRVGIMNVPTTYPAPEVDGFLISGGGGGRGVVQDAVIEQCYPPEALAVLEKIGYIVDERLDSLLNEKKLYQAQQFFSRLEDKNDKRTQAFINLARDYNIDFGFVVYRSSSNLAEFLLLPEWDRFLAGDSDVDQDFIEAVKHYYQEFDKQIKQLVTTFPDAEVILVSDHSMAKRQWSVNPNAFLQENGFQTKSKGQRSIYEFIKYFKRWVPFSLRQVIRNTSGVKQAYESMTPFDTKTSSAFSMIIADSVRSIYINDNKRFGGPVEECKIDLIRNNIIQSFNASSAAVKHGLKAYAKPDLDSSASKYYPDITLKFPDGYTASNESQKFISKYEIPKGPLGISSVTKGRLLCGKAHHPIAVITKNKWQVKPSSNKQDLRLIYDHILTVFNTDAS